MDKVHRSLSGKVKPLKVAFCSACSGRRSRLTGRAGEDGRVTIFVHRCDVISPLASLHIGRCCRSSLERTTVCVPECQVTSDHVTSRFSLSSNGEAPNCYREICRVGSRQIVFVLDQLCYREFILNVSHRLPHKQNKHLRPCYGMIFLSLKLHHCPLINCESGKKYVIVYLS